MLRVARVASTSVKNKYLGEWSLFRVLIYGEMFNPVAEVGIATLFY